MRRIVVVLEINSKQLPKGRTRHLINKIYGSRSGTESRSSSLDLIDIHLNNEGRFDRDILIDFQSDSGRMLADAVDSQGTGGRQLRLSFDRNKDDDNGLRVEESVVTKNHVADFCMDGSSTKPHVTYRDGDDYQMNKIIASDSR